jgi:hypothetical protein
MVQKRKLDRVGDGQPKRPYPYDESLDEPAELIEKETVEIEAERPLAPNPNVERTDEKVPDPPVFEE